ncbi:MAG: RsmD family RNA methyltransferase [Pseudomonadaceae bacterium]|nr:RsmD family RNA methyltransferase [Pseudomonadaceae bacterium]
MHKPETRVITGSLKGKKLLLPDDAAVRPTRERVRQAVFNTLGSRLDWHGLAVADICCGSGAWGLEALSRGAAQVWLVDKDVRAVRRNVTALGLDGDARVQVIATDAVTWRPPAPLDVVLADPPYGSGLVQGLLARAGTLAAKGAWWALEVGTAEELDVTLLHNVAEKRYGVSKIVIGQTF